MWVVCIWHPKVADAAPAGGAGEDGRHAQRYTPAARHATRKGGSGESQTESGAMRASTPLPRSNTAMYVFSDGRTKRMTSWGCLCTEDVWGCYG